MINPPKTKEQYMGMYHDKMKEVEKHHKDLRAQDSKVFEIKMRISNFEFDMRRVDSDASGLKSEVSSLKNSARAKEAEGQRLMQSRSASDVARGRILLEQARALYAQAARKESDVSYMSSRANDMHMKLGFLKNEYEHEKYVKKEFDHKMNRLQKEAKEFLDLANKR